MDFALAAMESDRSCIAVTGNDGKIIKNTLIGCDSEGIDYTGDSAEILHNRIDQVPDDDEAIRAFGNNLNIGYNEITLISQNGINYLGNNSRIHDNDVIMTGADSNEPGIQIQGNDNRIDHNYAKKNTFSGIQNSSGDRNIYEYNTSKLNGTSGIRIQSGDSNIIRFNKALDNQGEGINNGSAATNTTIIDNLAEGNRTDICNSGSLSTFSGNTFNTGGSTTACVVDPLK